MKANETKTIPLQYAATTSAAGFRRLEAGMLQMGHLRNALIRHRNAARGSHRHAFTFKLQNAHLTDLHRNDPDFNSYSRRLLVSCIQSSLAKVGDVGQDLVGGLGPDKRFGVFVGDVQVAVSLQFGSALMHAAAQLLFGENRTSAPPGSATRRWWV